MAVNREAIFAALFARLAALPGVVYSSRVWQGTAALESAAQPAVYLYKGDERVVQPRGLPPRWELMADVVIACRGNEADPDAAPSVLLNQLLTAFEAAIARQPTEPPSGDATYANNPDMMWGTTLGGLCLSVTVDGEIAVDEGAVGLQALAVVPLKIVAASG